MKAKRKKRGLLVFAAVLAVLAALFVVEGLRSNNTLEVTAYAVPRSGSAPFRIAQVSDLHNAEFGAENERLVALLREEKPDLIAVTGDLVDSHRTRIDVALRFLEQAVEIAPCYYVTGNHEVDVPDYPELERAARSLGVTVLRDEAVEIETPGGPVRLIGLDDPYFTLYAGFLDETSAMVDVKLDGLTEEGTYQILLSHRPELYEVYCRKEIDLVLAGHAHGGQVRLPFLGGLYAPNQGFFPRYDGGAYQSGRTTMIVSRGLGNSRFPLRINNPAELVMIEIGG